MAFRLGMKGAPLDDVLRAAVLIGGTIGLFACATTALDEVGGAPGGEATRAQALGMAGVTPGLYVRDAAGVAPSGDYLAAMEVNADSKARVLFSYPGAAARVEGACTATASVKGASAKSLALRCSASSFDYRIVANDARGLSLENDKGQRFTLAKTEAAARAELRATCDASAFTATLQVTGGTADGRGARRTLVHVRPKSAPNPTTPTLNAPPEETFVVAGENKLLGRDLRANEYDLTLPSELAGHFDAELGFVNVETPFELARTHHALSCKVD